MLLSELLNRLSDLVIEPEDAHHLVEFFVARMDDEPSVVPVLWGLQALWTRYQMSADDATLTARRIFDVVNMQELQISGRLAVFKILDKALGKHLPGALIARDDGD